MLAFIAIIISIVSLLAYAGVAHLHETLSDVRYRAASAKVVTTELIPAVTMTWDGRHPKDARCRRMSGGCYVQRSN